jgi:hypothetical protein
MTITELLTRQHQYEQLDIYVWYGYSSIASVNSWRVCDGKERITNAVLDVSVSQYTACGPSERFSDSVLTI